jgi:hypothetical protein
MVRPRAQWRSLADQAATMSGEASRADVFCQNGGSHLFCDLINIGQLFKCPTIHVGVTVRINISVAESAAFPPNTREHHHAAR